MTRFLSKRVSWIAGAALIVTALLPIVFASRGPRTPSPREIRIVASEMAFYVEGNDEPNPTLRVRAGEQIRLVLRNEDAGISHNLAISSWQVATPLVTERGAEAVVVFRVPKQRGTYAYTCTPHSKMMQGGIQVE